MMTSQTLVQVQHTSGLSLGLIGFTSLHALHDTELSGLELWIQRGVHGVDRSLNGRLLSTPWSVLGFRGAGLTQGKGSLKSTDIKIEKPGSLDPSFLKLRHT